MTIRAMSYAEITSKEWEQMCDPRYIPQWILVRVNGNYEFCHGCGAVIEGGISGRCRYCGRVYGK